jgi:hypothetical protein
MHFFLKNKGNIIDHRKNKKEHFAIGFLLASDDTHHAMQVC